MAIDYSRYRAHPTTFQGVRFRSRLEARWAAFLTIAGWTWRYEPVDLNGWTPDFFIQAPNGVERTLVEVKPIDEFDADVAARITRAMAWDQYDSLTLFGNQPTEMSDSFGKRGTRIGWDQRRWSETWEVIWTEDVCPEAWAEAGNLVQYRKPQ